MKRKGFTLIELLAVIVILAIIAVITIPIILGVVDKAKVGAAKSSVLGYVDALEKSYVVALTNKTLDDWPATDSEGCYTVSQIKNYVKVKGRLLTDDTKVCLNEKHIVTSMSGKVDNYEFTYEGNKVNIGAKKDIEVVEKLTGDPIGPKVQSLIDNNTTYGNYTYMGGTYLKGVQENNYVWYNGFLWRIMGKNEDGSIRLITEENVTAIPYGATNQGLTYSTNTGYINDWLNEYFLSNLDSSKTSIIKEADWCINVTTSSTSTRTNCTGGTLVTSKVGLISIDEYNLSGASPTKNTYYLVDRQDYWTMTANSASYAWGVYDYGGTYYSDVINPHGVRPVINVSSDATITRGNGTLGDSYILNQTTSSKTGKLNEKASSGEYVSLSGKTYRIVSKDSIGTKLIYDGYYEEITGTVYTMKYNETTGNNTFVTTSGIGQKLNGDILNWLTNNNQTIKDKIESSNWYQTNGLNYGISYTTIINDTSSSINTKVGLIRVGEMMSGQSTSILTKNYTVRSTYVNAKNYWTMNKYTSASSAWSVDDYGVTSNYVVTYTHGVRPVIVVGTSTTITSGNGTLENPYIID